jgi:hypothetical protein
MKKWFICLITLTALSCNKITAIDPIPEGKQVCNNVSVFEFSNTEVLKAGEGMKYTYNKKGDIIGLDEGKTPNYSYDFKYDKSSLTLSRTFLPTKSVVPFTFLLNENNSIKSYEGKRDDNTSIKGLYEYDNDNRLIKFSVTFSSISSPDFKQIETYFIKWKDDNIDEISTFAKYVGIEEKFIRMTKFEYQEAEIVNKDNFYNLVFFDVSNNNFEGYIYLNYIGFNKGKAPKNLPVKYLISYEGGQVRDGGVVNLNYKFDVNNRVTSVKIFNNVTLPVFRSFNYLCL